MGIKEFFPYFPKEDMPYLEDGTTGSNCFESFRRPLTMNVGQIWKPIWDGRQKGLVMKIYEMT